ncbi:MAG: DUF1993 domain-containing protein [Burkholderiaceae bacterium]|jgi:hypothetical protein|nr:MAG: DUF1993 domain-containing protein [Burkholderiaceae bacterium]
MTISMYQASLPVFEHALSNLSKVLEKGAAFAQSKNVDADRLLQQRLIFDMFPLIKQVQIACDTAARSAARLANVEGKAFPDTETTVAQARERIAATIAYLKTFKPAQVDGCEARTIEFKMGPHPVKFTGQDYLFSYALPNFLFHCVTAYDILRTAGAPIGKRDFLGL